MKLTPAQLGMRLLTSGSAPMMPTATMPEGIARGRNMLIKTTQQDFGYDLKAWHDHLAATEKYASASHNKPGNYPEGILAALNDARWIEAVRIAESTSLLQRIQDEERLFREATDRAERQWAGKDRVCPKCNTIFKSVQDRGQCPHCRFIFFASHPDSDDN